MPVRIGLAFPGDPLHGATWSGTPAGLAAGLARPGVDVVALPAGAWGRGERAISTLLAPSALPRAARHSEDIVGTLKLARAVATAGPTVARLRSVAARRRLAAAGELEAIVQLGTGFSLPEGPRRVTLEDMTIAQGAGLPYPHWQAMSASGLRARMERQRRAYEDAVACCTASRWTAGSIVRDYGIPAHKVHVVGLGRNRTPRVVERTWSAPRFLFVGRGWRHKCGEDVLLAFRRVRGLVPEARLDVVGDHPRLDQEGVTGHGMLRLGEGPERERLERLFEAATCFVMPSLYEGFGIVYVEAGSAGLPSIGTAVGGAADAIGDGGRLVAPGDLTGLERAMVELSDPQTAQELGARALRHSALFTWDAVADRVLRALELPGLGPEGLAPFLFA